MPDGSGGKRALPCRWKAAFVASLALLLASPAGAASVTFSDRTDWENALPSGDLFFVDFDGFEMETSFQSGALDVGPYSLQQSGIDVSTTSFNVIDVDDGGGIFDFFNVNASPYALLRVEADQDVEVDVVFANPVFAWGGDLGQLAGNEGLDLELIFDGDSTTLPIGAGEFLGFVSDTPVLQVTFLAHQINGDPNNGMNFSLDNTAGMLAPEPGTLLLVAGGLAGLARIRRRA